MRSHVAALLLPMLLLLGCGARSGLEIDMRQDAEEPTRPDAADQTAVPRL